MKLKPPKMLLTVWKELYEAAAEFQKAKPWEIVGDTDNYAVQDPRTGITGYTAIMGALGNPGIRGHPT